MVVEHGALPDALEEPILSELWELAVGVAVVPLATAAIDRRGFSKPKQRGVMIATAAFMVLVGSGFRGELDDWQFTATAMFNGILVTQTAYVTLWKAPMFGNVIAKIEAATGGDPVAVQAALRDGVAAARP